MLQQTDLPLSPSWELFGAANGALVRSRDLGFAAAEAISYRSSKARTAFQRGRSARALEPYHGRERLFLEPTRERGLHGVRHSRRILVRTGMAEALRRDLLRSSGEGGGPITIGSSFEPYPSEEARIELTRSLLDVLGESRGLELLLTTRSPLVLRDQDLLRRLDLKHSVTVQVPIPTLDARLADRIEPGAPDPGSRLDIVRTLTADGIATGILCNPVLPGINSSADELDPLFAAAKRAGAIDVRGIGPSPAPGDRRRLTAWLEEHYPDRREAVCRQLDPGRGDAALGTLRRLRLAYGFPNLTTGRG